VAPRHSSEVYNHNLCAASPLLDSCASSPDVRVADEAEGCRCVLGAMPCLRFTCGGELRGPCAALQEPGCATAGSPSSRRSTAAPAPERCCCTPTPPAARSQAALEIASRCATCPL
jgi:hypothetical protein